MFAVLDWAVNADQAAHVATPVADLDSPEICRNGPHFSKEDGNAHPAAAERLADERRPSEPYDVIPAEPGHELHERGAEAGISHNDGSAVRGQHASEVPQELGVHIRL